RGGRERCTGTPSRCDLLELNDEWAVQRGRYMTLETIQPLGDGPAVSLPNPAHAGERGAPPQLHHAKGHDQYRKTNDSTSCHSCRAVAIFMSVDENLENRELFEPFLE